MSVPPISTYDGISKGSMIERCARALNAEMERRDCASCGAPLRRHATFEPMSARTGALTTADRKVAVSGSFRCSCGTTNRVSVKVSPAHTPQP